MATAFWVCLAIAAYTFVGYPLLIGAWAKLRGRPVRKGPYRGSFSLVLAVHNEAGRIAGRIEELRRQARATGLTCEIVVATDGCRDGTTEIARGFENQGEPRVRVVELTVNQGKAAALTAAVEAAIGNVLLFADARQRWADDAILELLANFADADVGAVSGDLVLESAPGVLAGVGAYWRFEKWLRRQESRVWAQVGVTGAISGVRRGLFRPIPPGTLLDDVYWPLCVALAGHRVVHDESAKAYDRLPEKSSAEFRRKVRTLAGNYQLAGLVPRSLVPWRNRVWPMWVSRKLMRLAAPWALVGMAITAWFLPEPYHLAALAAQGVAYGLGAVGVAGVMGTNRLTSLAGSFLVLNAAAWCAFWTWVLGRTGSAWRKVEYGPNASATTELS